MSPSRRRVAPLFICVALASAAGCGDDRSATSTGSAGPSTAAAGASAVDDSLFVDGDQVVVQGSGAPSDTTYRIGRANIRAGTAEARRVHTCLLKDPQFTALDPRFSANLVNGTDESQAAEWSTYTFRPKAAGGLGLDQQVMVGYGVPDPGDTVSTWYQAWNSDLDIDGGEADTDYVGAANVVNRMVVVYNGLENGGAEGRAARARADRCTPNTAWDRAVPRPATTPDEGSTGYDIDGPTSSIRSSTPG